jgi:hypothetical protein
MKSSENMWINAIDQSKSGTLSTKLKSLGTRRRHSFQHVGRQGDEPNGRALPAGMTRLTERVGPDTPARAGANSFSTQESFMRGCVPVGGSPRWISRRDRDAILDRRFAGSIRSGLIVAVPKVSRASRDYGRPMWM